MEALDKIILFIKSVKFYGPIITIVGCIIVYHLIIGLLDKAVIVGKTEYDKKKRRTIIILFKNIVKYVTLILGLLIVLNIYGVNTNSIIAGLGVVGVVIGLALQDALKDIIGGINIIMDNYYVVGDLVTFNSFTGTVSEFGLKSTKIVSANGETLIIANRNIDRIVNLSQKKVTMYLQIPTAYECNEKDVEKVLVGALDKVKKLDDVVPSECKYLGIDQLADSSVNYLIQVKCSQGKQFAVKRAVLGIVKEAYDNNDIKIPYNQLEVHNGKDI